MIPPNHEFFSVIRDHSRAGKKFLMVTATPSGTHIIHTKLSATNLMAALDQAFELCEQSYIDVPREMELIEDDDFPRAIPVLEDA